MEEFKNQFIKKSTDDLEYGEMSHHGKRIFNHYYFNIESVVKDFIQKEGPIATASGLWDPKYLKGDILVATTIGHEGMVKIYPGIS